MRPLGYFISIHLVLDSNLSLSPCLWRLAKTSSRLYFLPERRSRAFREALIELSAFTSRARCLAMSGKDAPNRKLINTVLVIRAPFLKPQKREV